jgi:hypothetical protein
MPRRESGQAARLEPALPEDYRPRAAAGLGRDRRVAVTVRQQQDDARPTGRIRAAATGSLSRFKLGALLSRQHQSSRWHASSYALQVMSTSHL